MRPTIATPFTGTQMIFLTAKAKNASIAQTFLTDYVMTTEWMDSMYAQNPRPPAWIESADKVASDPLMKGFMDYGAQGTPMPAIAAASRVILGATLPTKMVPLAEPTSPPASQTCSAAR